MNWSNSIDIYTFNDAWKTWDNFFRKQYKKSVNFKQFYESTLKAHYKYYLITSLKKMRIENLNLDRLKAKTPEEAYEDKPRGQVDIDSVHYHMKTNDCVSPIVLIQINKKLIMLDGVHRVVAANFRKSKILICIIKI